MDQKIIKAIGDRLIDENSIVNKTNSSTSVGILTTISSSLLLIPDPNSQALGVALALVGTVLTFCFPKKKY